MTDHKHSEVIRKQLVMVDRSMNETQSF